MNPTGFHDDLLAKPSTLRALARSLRQSPAPWPVDHQTGTIVLAGMGSSCFAADVAALRMRRLGLSVVSERASAEHLPLLRQGDVLVGISASGASLETNRFLQLPTSARRLALSNTRGSEIDQWCDATIDMAAMSEVGGVACRSFTHTLVMLMALEIQLSSGPDGIAVLAAAVDAAADATQSLLDRQDQWLGSATELLAGPHGCWVLAPAERLSSASQGALMLREGPRIAAVGCETGDWSHVDVYLTKTLDYRALLFTGSRWDDAAVDWMTQRSATLVSVGARQVDFAKLTIRYPQDDDPVVALLTETIVAELVAWNLWSQTVNAERQTRNGETQTRDGETALPPARDA